MTSLKHGSNGHLIVLITISLHVNILVIWAGWGFHILLVDTMKVVGQTQCIVNLSVQWFAYRVM